MKRPTRGPLHRTLPRGTPLGTDELRQQRISPALAYYHVRAGNLVRLGRGVFATAGDELTRDSCLNFLSRRIPGLHVGGKSALASHGVRHNLSARERLSLWGSASGRLPTWFTQRFPAHYVARTLFDKKLAPDFGLKPLPEKPNGPLVSVPERAMLELLSEVGRGQGIEEARNLLESLRSPRVEILGTLLRHCPRVKVVRLCVQWAEELDLGWATDARLAAGPRGKGRWLKRLPDGRTLVLKP